MARLLTTKDSSVLENVQLEQKTYLERRNDSLLAGRDPMLEGKGVQRGSAGLWLRNGVLKLNCAH